MKEYVNIKIKTKYYGLYKLNITNFAFGTSLAKWLIFIRDAFREACNFTKINTPPWVFFTFLKLYKWYQIAQRITYDLIRKLLHLSSSLFYIFFVTEILQCPWNQVYGFLKTCVYLWKKPFINCERKPRGGTVKTKAYELVWGGWKGCLLVRTRYIRTYCFYEIKMFWHNRNLLQSFHMAYFARKCTEWMGQGHAKVLQGASWLVVIQETSWLASKLTINFCVLLFTSECLIFTQQIFDD